MNPSAPQPTRIAMWSGPRNISTAMMRAWENRVDTVVIDEPFYAHYLVETGIDHPGRDAVIAKYETDWRRVAEQLVAAVPKEKSIYYQKHMCHHMVDGVGFDWLSRVTSCFLIREPREVLTSWIKVVPHITLEETGLPQQLRIFDYVRGQLGQPAPVIDSRDVLENPRAVLTQLCDAVGVEFSDRMLKWPAGPRDSDGIWAPYWYASVERSTGFKPYQPKDDPVPDHLEPLLQQCDALYERFYSHRIRA